jgi:flagellar biosynthesis/type III secretory pathway chaperone
MLNYKEMQDLAGVYETLNKDKALCEALNECESLNHLQAVMETEKQELCEGRTARLWSLYMTMVSILQQFIRAERTGN